MGTQSTKHAPVEVSAPAQARDHASSSSTDLTGQIEALLLSAERPTPALRLAQALALVPDEEDSGDTPPASGAPSKPAAREHAEALKRVEAAVAELNHAYEETHRSFRIESVSGGYRVMTLPRYAGVIARLQSVRHHTRLTRQAVESLAIVAYRQPLTRAELEAIRGVSCGEVLKSLIERRLVTVKGRAEELGRPLLYGTTKQFLDHFGLASIKDLPSIEELKPAGL